MKRVFTIMCVVAIAAFMGNKAKAVAPDLSSLNGSHYYLIYLDADTEANYNVTPNIVQDLRPNWDLTTNPTGEKALYNWTGSGSNGYVFGAVTGKGSFGQVGSFLDLLVTSASGSWTGAGWTMRDNSTGTAPHTFPVDYTKITDDYHFHMAVKSSFAKSSTIQVMGSSSGGTTPTVTMAKFNVGVGQLDATIPNITPNFKSDGTTWNIIDMTVAQLKTYGWTNRATIPSGNYFVTLSGTPENELALDAVYFYLPALTAVNEVKANKLSVLLTNRTVEVQNATAPIEVYSVTGSLVKKSVQPIFGVEELAKGAYIIKSGSAVAKVIIK